MKLIKAKYIVVGTKKSKTGATVKVFAKRLTLECPFCHAHVIRHSFRCIKQKSCGCVNLKVVHGHTVGKRTPIYEAWTGLRNRCVNPKNKAWKHYGARGIKVCKAWGSFQNFHAWAVSAGWKPGLFLDRADVNGNYTPSNCRWITRQQSSRNMRHRLGFKKAKAIRQLRAAGWLIPQLAQLFGVAWGTVKSVVTNHSWPSNEEPKEPKGKQ